MTHAELIPKIRPYLETNLPAYLDLLHQMVAINSFTLNVSGINALSQLTADAFARLGFEARHIPASRPGYGQHLILTRPGSTGQKIGLVSHLDTVFAPDEERRHNFAWRREGDRIFGPGIIDIKGGTVMIYMVLDALRNFAPDIFEQYSWVVVLNAAEEVGSPDFEETCLPHLAGDTRACLLFEVGGRAPHNQLSVVVSRKGAAMYHIEVEGKAAHPGTAFEKGANAIVHLADVIRQVATFTDLERNLTFNIGTVAGGTTVNRVPHYAAASVEMRAFSLPVFEEGLANMLNLNNQIKTGNGSNGYRSRAKVEILHQIIPWSQNEGSRRLLAIWQETARTLGLTVLPEARGGISDGNRTWQTIPTLDGLGPAGGNAHCSERSPNGSKEQEYVLVSSFVPRALLNTLAILDLASR